MKTPPPLALTALAITLAITLAGASCHERDRTFDREHPNVISQDERKNLDTADQAGSADLTSAGVGAAWLSDEAAVNRLVSARCAHELTCSDVGPDRHYPTPDACVLQLRKSVRADLGIETCPAGVDGRALDDCVDTIRAEACNHRFDPIGSLPSCQAREICVKGGAHP